MSTGTASPAQPAAQPAKDVREQTLAQFSAELDRHARRTVGFAAMATALWHTRQQITALTTARTEIFEQIKTAYHDGWRKVPGTDWELKQTDPGEPSTYRAAASAAVKKANPAAWRRAQTDAPFVQVKAPGGVKPRYPVQASRPPIVAPNADLRVAAAAYKDSPAWAAIKELREREAELVERLEKLAGNYGWDGLPITFADGWTVSLRRRQYSSDMLAITDPELFEKLAETKIRQAAARIYLGKAGVHDEAVDLDGD